MKQYLILFLIFSNFFITNSIKFKSSSRLEIKKGEDQIKSLQNDINNIINEIATLADKVEGNEEKTEKILELINDLLREYKKLNFDLTVEKNNKKEEKNKGHRNHKNKKHKKNFDDDVFENSIDVLKNDIRNKKYEIEDIERRHKGRDKLPYLKKLSKMKSIVEEKYDEINQIINDEKQYAKNIIKNNKNYDENDFNKQQKEILQQIENEIKEQNEELKELNQIPQVYEDIVTEKNVFEENQK